MAIFDCGRKTVTTAGTAERLVPNERPVAGMVTIIALSTNTGKVYIGTRDVSGVSGSEAGEVLEVNTDNVGARFTVEHQQLYDVWIDATVNGEGVHWIAVE